MWKKRQEFMDLKQGEKFVHDYSKQFNHLAQYAPDQVDTDNKKKDRIMIGLSSKLQECMALNTGRTFPEFVSNIMIANDAITPTRKPRRGRLWLLCPVVLPRSTGRCTTTAPPIHLDRCTSISISVCNSSGLPAHLSISISGQRLRLYLHLHLCCACLHPRPLEPPPTTSASTVVTRATSLGSAPRRRRMPLRATSPIRHVVRRRWPLRRPAVSTTLPWRIFPGAIKSSWVHFL
jgi:hypothetical protein